MTHQAPLPAAASGADPGRQVAQLREVLRLVERIAGHPESFAADALLDEAARLGGNGITQLTCRTETASSSCSHTAECEGMAINVPATPPPPPRRAPRR